MLPQTKFHCVANSQVQNVALSRCVPGATGFIAIRQVSAGLRQRAEKGDRPLYYYAQRWALGGIIILIQSHTNKELLHVFGKVVF